MKTFRLQLLFLLLWFVSLMLMLYSCSPDPFPPNSPTDEIPGTIIDLSSPTDFAISSIVADTVTPPSNPMAPDDMSSYLSVRGTLGLNTFRGEYYATIRTQNNTYFLLDATAHSLIRFSYHLLSPFTVGEEIVVTGKLYNIYNSDTFTLGLTTYFVQPAQ